MRVAVKRRGLILSFDSILFLLIFTVLLGGAVFGARYMYFSHRLTATFLQASAVDSALWEYAHAHEAVDYTPIAPYSRMPIKDGHLRYDYKHYPEVLSYGLTREYPMTIHEAGVIANQRGGDNGVTDDGLDFGYFHQKIQFCKDGEKPGPDALYKFYYIPLDMYGNPVNPGNPDSEGFPVCQYALIVAVRSETGDTLYYLSKGSYPHEQLTKNRPAILDS